MSRGAVARIRHRLTRRAYRWLYVAYRSVTRTGPPRQLRASDLERILIVRNDAVGDLIVTTPILSYLAEVAPHAEVDILASSANHSLITGDSRVHKCYVSPHNAREWLALLRRLRDRRYDVTYSLRYGRALREGFIATAVACDNTQKVSVFRPKRYQGFFTTVIRTPRRTTHMSQRLLYVVQASLAHDTANKREPFAAYPMTLQIGTKEQQSADQFLTSAGVREFVAVNFSAREPDRDWPIQSCANVIRQLARQHPDLSFVLIPPASRAGDAASIVASCAALPVVIFPPSPNLLALAALIQRARIVITPDTAAVHIASACGRPVLGLYLHLKTRLWTPLGVPHRLVQAAPGAPIAAIPDQEIIGAFELLYEETLPKIARR